MSGSTSSTPEAPIAVAAPGIAGEVAAAFALADPAAALPRVLDPGEARETLHWGRNYLYVADWPAPAGLVRVVVKQFRHESWRARLDRRHRGSKAMRSWRVALAIREAGLPTPAPVACLESTSEAGPAWYVCRHEPGRTEARYVLRALALGDAEAAARFPDLPGAEVLGELGRLAARLHAAGFWHRDYSAGNVLLGRDPQSGAIAGTLVDLNRCRRPGRLGLWRRMRDLGRMPVVRPEHRRALLQAYFGRSPSVLERLVYRWAHGTFHGRHRAKARARGVGTRVRQLLLPRKTYPHIPAAPDEAGVRDRAVWDRLSDQPHQHAGRWSKLAVRVADAGTHLTMARAALGAAPRVARAYRRLGREPVAAVPFDGLGVCVRPHPEDPDGLLAAVEGLAVRHVLLRLHPWEDDHRAEEALARELAGRGHELVFSLPQNRELVRDPVRWRAKVAELAERVLPYGRAFQVGQAPNRSKWGLWNLGELQTLAGIAAEELRRHPGVTIAGPGVIDFEPHVTAAVVNWPHSRVHWDVLASLLYVDRRGAPESRQTGFDTAAKVRLVQAIAETARHASPRSWITEVNWPLREGPHAPAGRDVAVDEATAARYLARYMLLALGSGLVERVYWWQLVARGYGLAVAEPGGLRLRPAWHALATLSRSVGGASLLGPLAAPAGAALYRFDAGDRGTVVAGWAWQGEPRARLPRKPDRALDLLGREEAPGTGDEVVLGPDVRYFWFDGGV